METRAAPVVYEFGDFELDASHRLLRTRSTGRSTELTPRAYDTLLYLVEHAGQIVDKQVLMAAVWPNVVVEESNLTQTIYMLRRALGERPDEHQFIVTVPKRGYKFVGNVRRTQAETPLSRDASRARSSRPLHRTVAVLAVLLSLSAAAVSLYLSRNAQPHQEQAGTAATKSIAVLPFVNMSPEPGQEYFSDGVSEEILNLLAQVPELQVIARTSSFSFKGSQANVAEIARTLEVTHVLEGSVRKSGNRVRITAQLIDGTNSSHLWSQTYDRTLDDMLAVQTEIAKSVTEALKLTLFPPATGAIPAPSAAAYERYLQGQFFFGRRGTGDLARAATAYREALAIDPDFARAWAGLAGAIWIQTTDGDLPVATGLSELRAAAEKALSLDPRLAEAHFRLANYYWWSHDAKTAELHYEKAKALAPNSPLMLSTSAMDLATLGSMDDAIRMYARIIPLDPLSTTHRHNFGHLLYSAGRHAEAQAHLLKAIDLNPDEDRSILVLSLIADGKYAAAEEHLQKMPAGPFREHANALLSYAVGRTREGEEALARLLAMADRAAPVAIAEVYAYRGDVDEAFRWLGQANFLDPRAEYKRRRVSWEVRESFFLRSLQSDPRWQTWLTTIPESW